MTVSTSPVAIMAELDDAGYRRYRWHGRSPKASPLPTGTRPGLDPSRHVRMKTDERDLKPSGNR